MEVKESDITLQDAIAKGDTDPVNLVKKIQDYTAERIHYRDYPHLLSKCVVAQAIVTSSSLDWDVVQYMMLEPQISSKQMRLFWVARILSLEGFLARERTEIFADSYEDMLQKIFLFLEKKKEPPPVNMEEEIENRVRQRLTREQEQKELAERERKKEEAYQEKIRSLEERLFDVMKKKREVEELLEEVNEICIRMVSERESPKLFRRKKYASFSEALQKARLSRNENQVLLYGHQKGVADEELLHLIEKRVSEENMKAAVALLISQKELEDKKRREKEEEERKDDINRFGYATAIKEDSD